MMRLYVVRQRGRIVYAASDHNRFDREAVKRKYTNDPTVKFETVGFRRRGRRDV